jgi:hypothetical protein
MNRMVLQLLVVIFTVGTIAGCNSGPPPGRFQPIQGGGVLDTKTGVVWMINSGDGERATDQYRSGDNVTPAHWVQISHPIPAK